MLFYFPSTWRRLAAHFADKLYIFILQSPVLFFIATSFFKTDQLRIHWAHFVYLVAASFLYEFLSLWFFSTTLGKSQWGLLVISRESKNGDRSLTGEQAFMRVLVSKLNFFFGWVIFALALFKYNRTHMADWVAGTQVVGLAERSSPTKIRWLIGSVFIFFHFQESIKSASMTLNSFSWENPYIKWHSGALMKWLDDLEEMEFSLEFEDED